jgi:hypothetical protein
MKPKKFILDYEDSDDFEVLAICSHHPDYRLVWNINKFADLELQRSEKLFDFYSKKGDLLSQHIKYEYYDAQFESEYILIKNKEQNSFIVPELEMVDYFLFLTTPHIYPTESIKNKLLDSESIVTTFKVDQNQYKSISRLEIFS